MGERSSRKIKRLCERDVAYKVLTAQHKPDHTTIVRFRKDNQKELENLFVHVLNLCAEAGLLKLGLVALDGTKIEADADYCSEKNIIWTKTESPEWFIATKKDYKQRRAVDANSSPRGREPSSLSTTKKRSRKLNTKRGKKIYKKRSKMIEPIFGQIKTVRGINHFMRRGFDACKSEWKLICLTHNLLKIFKRARPQMT